MASTSTSSPAIRRPALLHAAFMWINKGRNAIVIVPQANALLTPAHIDAAKSVLESADVVLSQLEVPLPTVQHAFELARAAGITTILNPAPAQPLPAELVRNSTYLTPNEPEMEALSGLAQSGGTGWEAHSANKLQELGADQCPHHLGRAGCYARSRQGELLVPSFAVKTVDTTAAGDAFNGALAVALAEKMEFAKALRFANAAGALATTGRGAQPSLPLRQDVEKLMEA